MIGGFVGSVISVSLGYLAGILFGFTGWSAPGVLVTAIIIFPVSKSVSAFLEDVDSPLVSLTLLLLSLWFFSWVIDMEKERRYLEEPDQVAPNLAPYNSSY
ncbi:MAG: hypothetical protein FH754_00280 [Marinobacter sp.]|jgi:hypothetical protein|nr:hypothetical protein [Marinobacter sp.]